MASLKYSIGRAFPQAEDFQELALDVLARHAAEGVWFAPTNGVGRGDDYRICDELHHTGLIAQRRIPLWKENGMFAGYRVEFMWKDDLRYLQRDL